MKIHIDVRDDISPAIAIECVKHVVSDGRVSNNGKSYCYGTIFSTNEGKVMVATRPYRKSDCFLVYRHGDK